MGDNLDFARAFTATAAEGLSLLSRMETPHAPSAQATITAMMTQIQTGAKRLRARHVYQSAQGVLSAMHHESDAILQSRIRALGGLVVHYATGLAEIEDQTGETARLPQTPHGRWDAARTTLDALLPLAPAEDADALSRLMRASVAPAPLKETSSDVIAFPSILASVDPADVTVEADEIDVFADATAVPTEVAATHTPLPPKTAPSVEGLSLESLMREIVSDALATARQVGRTISLSYDMADATIAETLADDLRERLNRALGRIIRESLPEGRVGHIDINVAGEQLHIMAGTTALRVAIDPAQAPAAKPRINAASEAGLRSQLDALLDPKAGLELGSAS